MPWFQDMVQSNALPGKLERAKYIQLLAYCKQHGISVQDSSRNELRLGLTRRYDQQLRAFMNNPAFSYDIQAQGIRSQAPRTLDAAYTELLKLVSRNRIICQLQLSLLVLSSRVMQTR